jgi:hypothetical protein
VFGIEDALMKKRILFSLLWAVTFPAAYFIASMLMFGIIGSLGLVKNPPYDGFTAAGMLTLGIVGTIWACLFWVAARPRVYRTARKISEKPITPFSRVLKKREFRDALNRETL